MEKMASSTTTRRRANGPESDVVCVDLFCGAGGLTEGLQQSGVKVVAGVDFEEACRHPYEANHDGIVFRQADVAELDASTLDGWFGNAKVSVLAGCAPCQPFSNYARRYQKEEDGNSVENDERWSLLNHFGRLVEETAARHRHDGERPHRDRSTRCSTTSRARLRASATRSGSKSSTAPKYGLPQRRHRTVLLASRPRRHQAA
jgi:DNA (cytosine-5)-methyltransferase 1